MQWSLLIEERKLQYNPDLAKEIMRIAREMAEKYYGNFAKAFDTNKSEDWDYVKNEIDRLAKDETSSLTHLIDIIIMFYNSETNKKDKNVKIIARKMVSTSFLIMRTGLKIPFDKYISSIKQLNEVTLLAQKLSL